MTPRWRERAIPGRELALFRPLDLLAAAPEPGGPPVPVGREAGFALKVLTPTAPRQATVVPAGQGQVIVVLRGAVRLLELGGDAGKVVMTQRPERTLDLRAGQLYEIANDAQWSLEAAAPETVALAVSTSVPRQVRNPTDLLALARRRPHMAPRQLFANEMVRIELVASRGVLPFRGWVPYSHRSSRVEFAVGLLGRFVARLQPAEGLPWKGELTAGSMLRIPAGVAHRFRAGRGPLCVGLVVSALMDRLEGGRVDRDEVQGFTPFGRG